MATSKAPTPAAYLASLPDERRTTLAKVRQVIRKHLPAGYREVMNWGMISYEVPLQRHPYLQRPAPVLRGARGPEKPLGALPHECVRIEENRR